MPKVDPEALRAYRDKVQAQLDVVENELIPKLRNGQALGRMPAFGLLQSSDSARSSYTTFHETTWNNLQAMRESLQGIIDTLDSSAEAHGASDEVSGQNFENQL